MTQTKWLGVALIIFGAAACGQGGSGSGASAQSLGEKCATDADCKSGEHCLANVCAPAIPVDLGIALCKVTSDCASGDICVASVCLPQHVGGATFCDKDADCASTDQCLAQVCVPKLPSVPTGGVGLPFDLGIVNGLGQKCMQKSDCLSGLDCVFDMCLPLQTCKSDADCTGAQKTCETHAGICI